MLKQNEVKIVSNRIQELKRAARSESCGYKYADEYYWEVETVFKFDQGTLDVKTYNYLKSQGCIDHTDVMAWFGLTNRDLGLED